MKATQNVTNILYQLSTYCDKGTNNLGQVTNICDTRFAYFIKSMFLYELLKFSRCTNKSVWIKMKPTKKVTNIASQFRTYFDQGANNLAQVINISRNTRFIFFFKSVFGGIIKILTSIKKSVWLK